MLNLIFPDGTIITASSFEELERQLRASQWRSFKTRREFRTEMRHRAELWSGRKPKPVIYQTPKAFIYSLIHAELCMLDESLPGADTPS